MFYDSCLSVYCTRDGNSLNIKSPLLFMYDKLKRGETPRRIDTSRGGDEDRDSGLNQNKDQTPTDQEEISGN